MLLMLLVFVYTWQYLKLFSIKQTWTKNIIIQKKNNLLCCLGAKLHLEEVLEPVVGIVVDVKLHMAALKSFQ